ncbi:MAG: hypothetical protein ABIU63_09120 [Chitinophagaceae bacterium]
MISKFSTVRVWWIVSVLFSGFIPGTAQAQLRFQFMPALNGQTVNGLFTVQVQNTAAASYSGTISITVKDASNKMVLRAITGKTTLQPGNNFLYAEAGRSRLQFGTAAAAGAAAQTGRFPEGEYEYCFEFSGLANKSNASEQVFEDCFSYAIQPQLPLRLLYPDDGDTVCNNRPELTWSTAIPLNNELRYRLMLTEKNANQLDAAALLHNLPVLQQDNIAGNMLFYPSHAPALEMNKTYVWQVEAYIGTTKVNQSEIWRFTIGCGDKKSRTAEDSYREPGISLNGNFYIANSTLRLTVNNPGGHRSLEYAIICLSDPAKAIDNLPGVKVTTGLNKIDIAMEDIKGLETGKMYLLKIENIGNQPQYLRFIFKDDAALPN